MTRFNAFQTNCPIAKVTELLGEGWTLLIVREAFLGTRTFNGFERQLGIARNILATRLKKLVEAGLLVRRASPTDGRVVEYRLSPAGRALYPVLIGLTQWAAEHLCGDDCSLRFVERASGSDIARLEVHSQDGRVLGARDIAMVAGPDADEALQKRLKAAAGEAGDRQGVG